MTARRPGSVPFSADFFDELLIPAPSAVVLSVMEYKIKKPLGACGRCEQEIALGAPIVSTILLEAAEPARRDFCVPCFDSLERKPEDEFAYWRTRRAGVKETKRVIDFPTLKQLFFRMTEQPGEEYRKICYLVALLLMRKKLLQLKEFVTEGGRDFVVLTAKDREGEIRIEAPSLRAEEFVEMREKLAMLLDVDLEGDGSPAESSATVSDVS